MTSPRTQKPPISPLEETTTEFLNHGKKLANLLCEEGVTAVKHIENSAEGHAGELLQKVRDNPLASLLIATGVGFVLSKLLKK